MSDLPYPKAVAAFPTVRQSLLSAFDACALEAKFDLDYRHGWTTPPQARGRIFHRFAAKALEAMASMDEDSIPVDAALAILHEVLRQDDVDRECPVCGTAEIKPGMDDGYRTCGEGHRFETEFVNIPMSEVKDLYWIVKKWAHDNTFEIDKLADVEKRLHATVRYVVNGIGTERVLTGQLDALLTEGEFDERAIVLDWKDTFGMPGPSDVSFEGYFQQRFYAWLVMKNYKHVESVTLREFYVRFSEPREATIFRTDLDDIEAELAALVERFDRSVEEELWIPTPGKHCSYCPRPTACPIPKFARGAGRIADDDDAADRAKQLLVADAIVKQNKEALAVWASRNGPIEIKDAKGVRVWGHRESRRVSRPTKEELEAALARGEVDLAKLYPERKVTKFEPHVPKGPKATDDDAELLAQLQEAVAESRASKLASK